jgi:hypothetical protein
MTSKHWLLCAIACQFFSISTEAVAQERVADEPIHSWQFVGLGAHSSTWVDDKSLVRTRHRVSFWVAVLPTDAPIISKYPRSFALAKYSIDCEERAYAMSYFSTFKSNGELIVEKTVFESMAPVRPNSIVEDISLYTCSGRLRSGFDKVEKLSDLNDVRKVVDRAGSRGKARKAHR